MGVMHSLFSSEVYCHAMMMMMIVVMKVGLIVLTDDDDDDDHHHFTIPHRCVWCRFESRTGHM